MAEAQGTVAERNPNDRVCLLASTGNITFQDTSDPYSPADASPADTEPRGYFESAQWTPDGTTILTLSSSNTISGYVVPQDLLAPHIEPLSLYPQSTIPLPEPTNVLASSPYFNLSEAYTNQLLVSSRDHPIQLFYLFPPLSSHDNNSVSHAPLASYPLTKARSETFLTATSLVWPAPGSHFIAGCRNLLAKFDITRTGEEPLLRIKTIPSERHLSKGGGVGMRGTISTLSAQPPDQNGGSLVAAGTWTRWVGLYDFAQGGECISTWSVESAAKETALADGSGSTAGTGGGGITQTIWSPCGRYLLISERKSRGILVYDVRVTGQLLGWLKGREARTNQRIQCDVFPGQDDFGGFEVWSGTTDGTVKMWEGVGSREGANEPAWGWEGHGSTVGSTCLHQSGAVVATCSGSWTFPEDETCELPHEGKHVGGRESTAWMRRTNKESSLKFWGLGSQSDKDVTEHSDPGDGS
ncbi:WD40-repeat-containing domain protein [Pseudomassariella vexata]|uniref:WD40-repeat-containing domain protein n=1 Tax=Pseudomassariella vexata TaxID=1141098 RepID=A0A1Y2E0W0_9PEZI|nr:WD40-repeat-containing domain protein [Pseudomassariella vexata]ORY65178.1 WD40-repeat-containing domain protein [Pseudomassariella vexata]